MNGFKVERIDFSLRISFEALIDKVSFEYTHYVPLKINIHFLLIAFSTKKMNNNKLKASPLHSQKNIGVG